MTNKYKLLLKQKLASVSGTNAEDWFIVSRARHGMELMFRCIKEQRGNGTVITQPFTCVSAINPIIAAGLLPIYCDISRQTYSCSAADIGKLLDEHVRAVVVQHTFGIPADMEAIKKSVVSSCKSIIIEDSAHCLGYVYKTGGTPQADISVHSFGAEKFLKTNFGGALWVNPAMEDQLLRAELVKSLSELPKTSAIVSARVWLYPRLNGVLNRLPASLSEMCRNLFLVSGLFRSPIMPIEQKTVNFEHCQQLRKGQLKKILGEFARYDQNFRHRVELTKIYSDALANNTADIEAFNAPTESLLAAVRYPVLAKTAIEAERLFVTLKGKGMYIGKWYRPLFFPGVYNVSDYSYKPASCPISEDISARILNLPTSLSISPQVAKEIAYALIS